MAGGRALPPERILRFGEKDNFWAMGETGPCGPCSEIHYYRAKICRGTCAELVNGPGDDTVEIWNLVFMQFERDAAGHMHPLPKPCVDTGAGLERIAAVLQGVPLQLRHRHLRADPRRRIAELAQRPYEPSGDLGPAFRVIADHARAAAFLLADGVVPSNEGRGYVLRRIVRRALRYGRTLGFDGVFLVDVVPAVIGAMGDDYPELATRVAGRGATAAHRGGEVLPHAQRRHRPGGPGARAQSSGARETRARRRDRVLLLRDSRDPARHPRGVRSGGRAQRGPRGVRREARGRTGARAGELEGRAAGALPGGARAARVAGRAPASSSATRSLPSRTPRSWRCSRRKAEVDMLTGEGEVVLDRTPFYAEAGRPGRRPGRPDLEGRPRDRRDTQRPVPGLVVHHVTVEEGVLRRGSTVRAEVHRGRRLDTQANHTATHLLHAALHRVLGPSAQQAGSLVEPERLRFDFSWGQPLLRRASWRRSRRS